MFKEQRLLQKIEDHNLDEIPTIAKYKETESRIVFTRGCGKGVIGLVGSYWVQSFIVGC